MIVSILQLEWRLKNLQVQSYTFFPEGKIFNTFDRNDGHLHRSIKAI